jgi:hypothetical protein
MKKNKKTKEERRSLAIGAGVALGVGMWLALDNALLGIAFGLILYSAYSHEEIAKALKKGKKNSKKK